EPEPHGHRPLAVRHQLARGVAHAWTGLGRTYLGRVLVRAATATAVVARGDARRRRRCVP
ncbi:hypothetical protein, partial [Streptomyces sp. NPDC005568]|uniref:hypothetical protein n=1 Tax=Streptomyces sp. NPDC005568 TaxID=3156887 RepID=UPI0033BC1872